MGRQLEPSLWTPPARTDILYRLRTRIASHRERLFTLVLLIGFLWLLEIVDALIFRQRLNGFGIQPRHLFSIWHIYTAPFLHGSIGHLAANTGPLFVLGWLVIARGEDYFWRVTFLCATVAGLGVWLLAPYNSVHIGASGVIFGYFGFLLVRGYLERSPSAVLVAVLVALFYGGMLIGVLPGQTGVSWQGHLFGFIGGVLSARWMIRD